MHLRITIVCSDRHEAADCESALKARGWIGRTDPHAHAVEVTTITVGVTRLNALALDLQNVSERLVAPPLALAPVGHDAVRPEIPF